MRKVSDKRRENQNTHFVFNSKIMLFIYEIMWKNIVQWGRPQMTLRRMHIACWIPKATDTHSEYVIFIAFPLQQWLQGHASMLHYMYIVCLILYRFCGKWMKEYFSSSLHTICRFFIVVEVIFGR